MRARHIAEENLQFQIAPMIDVIFILILFFMCSAGAIKVENHLSSSLPGTVASDVPINIPDEQVIRVMSNGSVVLNERPFDANAPGHQLPELVATLDRFRQASAANQTEAMVTVSPERNANYQRVIDVMNACAQARITNVGFQMEVPEE